MGGTTTATRYVVDDRTPSGYAQVVEEWQSVYNGTSWSAWSLARKYTYGLSRIRQERLSGGAVVGTEYYGYDGHGNVALLVDGDTGAEGNTYSYDAYGVLLSQGGNTPNHYQYSGEQWDSDLGMYYLRARYLNPQSGRFWTMDTFEGNSSTPLSLHKYLYAHANPVNGIDPTGHEFSILGVSVSMSMSQSFSAIYNGVVSAFGAAARATIFGVQAGKSMNEILTEFVLDETGLSVAIDGYDAIKAYFDEEEAGALVAYQAWQEEVLAAFVMSIPDEQDGEFDIEFVPQCFVAGTLIAVKDGFKPIEEVSPGDFVWSWNEPTHELVLRQVVERFVRNCRNAVIIQVGKDVFIVTEEHPFYLLNKGWVKAGEIATGDRLANADGYNPVVESAKRATGSFVVYNFEVDVDHNYYVGEGEILTHNASAAQMRRTLGISSHPLLAAHHIVSRFAKNADNQRSIALLKSVGISLEHGANGVALPKSLKARPPTGKFAGYTAHSVVHTKKYYENVRKELELAIALGGRKEARLTLQRIGNDLRLGVKSIYE